MKRLIKLSETLTSLGYENEKIYDSCKTIISEINDIIDDIFPDQNTIDIEESINLISDHFYDIKNDIETAKSNGQENEDALYNGNSIIDDLNSEIESTQSEIDEVKNAIEEFQSLARKTINFKKIANKRYICHIHDEIMEYCEGAINKCDNALSEFSHELSEEEIEDIVNDFIGDINHASSWVMDLIEEAEDANERMSNGIDIKNDAIDELTAELDNLIYELKDLTDEYETYL